MSFKYVFVFVKDFWESFKEVICNRIIVYFKVKRREFSRDRVRIINRLVKLKFKFVNGEVSVKFEIFELELAFSVIFR